MKKITDISVFTDGAEEEWAQERRETVEYLLRRIDKELLTVVSMECLPGSQQGDNYMSVIKRIRVRGTRQNCHGKTELNISLIFKRQIASLQRRKLFRADEAFANEINAYTELVPVLEDFSRNRLPFPQCLYAGTDAEGDLIVLEDLQCRDLYMVDRRKSLTFWQCRIIMRELANFHAVSLAMKQIQPARFLNMKKKVREIVYNDEAAEFYTHSLETSLRGALDSLHYSNRDRSLDAPIKAVERLRGKLYTIMSSTVRNSAEPWNVLCHGDIWVNNLMFNENKEQAKLIDLQAMRYTSLVIDIIHLLYTSAGAKVRLSHTDELLQIYHEALIKSLRMYVPIKEDAIFKKLEAIFSFESIQKEYYSRIKYGLGIAMWLLPAVTFHPDHIPDLDTVTMNDFKTKNHDKTIAQMLSPDYHSRMLETVLEFYKNGVLDSM